MQSSFFASSNAGMKCVDGWSEGEGEEKVEHQMRKLELEAYAAVVRAFGAQSEFFTWVKERLMADLRKELRVTEEQHRMVLGEVDDSLLEYRPSCRMSPGSAVTDGNANGSQSRKKQKMDPVVSTCLESAAAIIVAVAGGGTLKRVAGTPRAKKTAAPKNLSQPPGVGFDIPVDNWLGRRVKTRWPDDGCCYEAVITRYDRERGLHALVYDMDTADETWDWVNLKDMNKNDLIWMDTPRVPLAGKRVPPEEGAGIGRDNVNQGMKWQVETAGGVLTALLGKQKNSQRGQQTMSSPQQQARPWAAAGMPHLDIGLVARKGSNSVEILDCCPFSKEATDALEQEESMEKLEHIKNIATEHEVGLHRALAEVGELEADNDT
ncbi:hypothetical protein CY35_16G008200 [Sphagnum magellanicum]|nr:hypothetical protein CY35_16G008200 [Sphagnum magellanicum]